MVLFGSNISFLKPYFFPSHPHKPYFSLSLSLFHASFFQLKPSYLIQFYNDIHHVIPFAAHPICTFVQKLSIRLSSSHDNHHSSHRLDRADLISHKPKPLEYRDVFWYTLLERIFKKLVLSLKEIAFLYPLGLTLLHMTFSSVLCFVLTKVLKILKVEEGMTLEIFQQFILTI
ncbi:hypothetical protein QVD17_02867 [Tagetes erecta]|uniref:Uncharacterized protein n=1 Tax=Tagetes erecta TaxID=13708 RepID=A0AAD8LEQ0_TARER|nr:hypothetical protein QVD17_02867 [Tagetes erecta]